MPIGRSTDGFFTCSCMVQEHEHIFRTKCQAQPAPGTLMKEGSQDPCHASACMQEACERESCLLCCRGHGVKADEGKEDDRGGCKDAVRAVRHKRLEVGAICSPSNDSSSDAQGADA